MHKKIALSLLAVCAILALTAAVGFARMWASGELLGQGPAADAALEPTADPSVPTATPEPTEVPTATPEPTETPVPTPSEVPEPTETPIPTAAPWTGPYIKEQAVEAGPEYFADAAFLGNSVLSGLWYYDYEGLFPKNNFFWEDGLTVLGASPYAAKLTGGDYGKIYVGFGMNELSYEKGTLRQAFNTVLDKLQADHPDAIIYLVSVSPVSRWRSSNDSAVNRNLVISFNDMLLEIARERQVWYLDVYSVLCDDEGYLPADVTNDGVHFTPAHYENWINYMKTHYVPDGTEPAGDAPQPEAG